jgi:hypothetical protein
MDVVVRFSADGDALFAERELAHQITFGRYDQFCHGASQFPNIAAGISVAGRVVSPRGDATGSTPLDRRQPNVRILAMQSVLGLE